MRPVAIVLHVLAVLVANFHFVHHSFLLCNSFMLKTSQPTKNDGYDPRKSKVSDDKMEQWRSAQVQGDLLEVPGIGPAAVKHLVGDAGMDDDERITNTYQLMGHYLKLKGPDREDGPVDCYEHNEKFWQFLKERGISAHRSAVVRAIAEKLSVTFPGLYDPNLYEMDESE